MKSFSKFLIAIFTCQFVGFLGSLVTTSSISTWYKTLNKASFNPPNWVFGPAWTILFLLMGISLYLIWIKKIKSSKNKTIALIWFFAQLVLNFFWSFLFFYLHQPLLALIEIIVLWIAILINLIKFYKISHLASYLLSPYLLWVGFAFFLNLSIVILNPSP